MCSRLDLATLRVRKDLNELAKGKFAVEHATTQIEFPDGVDNLLRILITIAVTDHASAYANGDFKFRIEIPKAYPFHAPVVFSLDRIWHPNIDLHTGRVMFAILGKDWRPVLSINTILLGLQLIFIEPSIEFPMNEAAANAYRHSPQAFRRDVQLTLQGGVHFGLQFVRHPRYRNVHGPRKRERGLEHEIEQMTIVSPDSHGAMDMTDVENDDDPYPPSAKRHRMT